MWDKNGERLILEKEAVANASIEDIIRVAKVKHQNLLSKDSKATVKSIINTL